MRQRILCPKHEELTPSCVIYETTYKCFGCGATGPLTELKGIDVKPTKAKPKEDINAALAYIKTLPTQEVRGLDLPCDDKFFYLVWPDAAYYIKRLKDATGYKSKYICPTGHLRPLYTPQRMGKGLLVCEGELNALSAATALKDWAICSPGGTGEFAEARVSRDLTFYRKFDNIRVVVDKDKAGAIAAIQMKAYLSRYCPNVTNYLVEKDFNDILVYDGKTELRRQLKEKMEVY